MIRRVEKKHYIIIALLLTLIFTAESTQLIGINDYFNYHVLYFTRIALWTVLGIVIRLLPSSKSSGLVRLRKTVYSLAFIFAVFHLLCYGLIGFFTSFGKNLYDLTPLGILSNIVPMCAMLISGEMCRSFLINNLARKKPFIAIMLFSVVFALFNMSLGNINTLTSNLEALDYLTYIVFPQLTLSITASYLVYLSGPVPAILYLGIIRSFDYISPYIPNPPDIPRLLFNVLIPLLSVSIILKIYAKDALGSSRTNWKKDNVFGWVITSALSVAIVWFSVGIFPIFPSVVLTGSMEPKIMPGDIVIVEKNVGDSVKVGDIIMYYSKDEINITHRVIEIKKQSGETLYIMKGDNNEYPDAVYVSTSQIKGRVIGIIPEIGKIALSLKNSSNT